jgi:hypothetical protein
VTFELGDPVQIAMTKWGDHPHWQIPGVWLGRDGHGDWIGIPAGTSMARPGLELALPHDQVGLVPAPGADVERAFLATFHAPGGDTRVYVDMTTPPRWDDHVVRTVDLDLDVSLMQEGHLVVDDEDEFAEHRVELGYPPEIVALAEASRDRIHRAIVEERAPFDGSHAPWLAALERLTGAP